MGDIIKELGFEECDGVPVRGNEWTRLLMAVLNRPSGFCVKKQITTKNASNIAGAIRKTHSKMKQDDPSIKDIKVTNIAGCIYIEVL